MEYCHLVRKFVLLGLIVLVGLSGIFGRDLWTPDEPRVAAICLKMARSGDFLIPNLAGQPYLEKPPLGFLVGSVAIQTLEPMLSATSAVRLVSVLWGFGLLLLAGLLTMRVTGESETAWRTMLVLGTSWGFIVAQHWIRLDPALAFLVVAAVLAFAEAFIGDRPWWAAVGGVLAGGAFLTKGLVGPALVFPAWVGLLAAYGMSAYREKQPLKGMFVAHLAGAVAVSLAVVSWFLVMQRRGGGPMIEQWFWRNQIDRTIGRTSGLGHNHSGEPWYYLLSLVVLTIPWSPFVLSWLWSRIRRPSRRPVMTPESIFLLFWALGAVALLTIPATKRGVYLIPALPAFALIGVMGWNEARERWKLRFARLWMGLCFVLMLLLTLSPIWAGALAPKLQESSGHLLLQWGWMHVLVLACVVSTLGLIRSRKWRQFEKTVGATSLLMLAIWTFPARVIDCNKSLKGPVQRFAGSVSAETWAQTRGWDLSETMRALLYVHAGLEIANCCDVAEATAVLEGTDPRYRFLVYTSRSKSDLPEIPERIVIAEGETTKRQLFLVAGARASMMTSRRRYKTYRHSSTPNGSTEPSTGPLPTRSGSNFLSSTGGFRTSYRPKEIRPFANPEKADSSDYRRSMVRLFYF